MQIDLSLVLDFLIDRTFDVAAEYVGLSVVIVVRSLSVDRSWHFCHRRHNARSPFVDSLLSLQCKRRTSYIFGFTRPRYTANGYAVVSCLVISPGDQHWPLVLDGGGRNGERAF